MNGQRFLKRINHFMKGLSFKVDSFLYEISSKMSHFTSENVDWGQCETLAINRK